MKKSKMIIAMFAVMLCMTAFIFPVTAYAGGGEDTESTPPPESTLETPEPTPNPEPNPFTPEGQGEVIDHATDADGKEFYTIKTKDDNVFFLVIDTQRNTQNVYFLGMVDEIDLLALARENSIGKTEPTTPQGVEPTPPTTSEPQPTEPTEPVPEPQPEKSGGMGGMILVVVLVVAAAGGAFYFFKIRKPKQSVKGDTYLDEYDFEDDEDEPVIEDDTEPGNE